MSYRDDLIGLGVAILLFLIGLAVLIYLLS
jgi:hypothetical protein